MAGLLDFPDFLRGLLGGQAPPQQMPQQQQASPFNYGGGNAGAAFQNLIQTKDPFSAIGNAFLGATTGQRTDPVGMYQQMAETTYRALVEAGVPEPQARLGATNPEVQKAITAKMFPTYQFHAVDNTGISFDPTTGRQQAGVTAPRAQQSVSLGGQTAAPFNPNTGTYGQSVTGPPVYSPHNIGDTGAAFNPQTGQWSSPFQGGKTGTLGAGEVPYSQPGGPILQSPLAPPAGAAVAPAPAPPASSGPGPTAPGVTLPMGSPISLAQKEEQTGLGKTWADLGKAIQTDAQSASKVKATLSRLRQLNDQAPSGPAAEHWQNLLSATRIDPKTVAAGTEFQALSSKMVKDSAGGGLGPGFSEGDRRSIERQVPQLIQDKTGRRNLMDYHEKIADRQLKVQEMAAAWRNRPNNPTRSLEGFAEHIADYADKNPLFPQGAPTSGPGSSQSIPEGATATHPNGQRIIRQNGKWVPLT